MSKDVETLNMDPLKNIYFPFPKTRKMLLERKKMSPEEKRLHAKDEIDMVDTSELENMEVPPDMNLDAFLVRNDINLAKFFYEKDGGYSVRKLKEIYLKEKEFRIKFMEERKKRRMEKMGIEAEVAEVDAAEIKEEGKEEGKEE